MWDIISGIDYLEKQGIIDKTRWVVWEWSQGGYISAFLTTNSNLFRAISVELG